MGIWTRLLAALVFALAWTADARADAVCTLDVRAGAGSARCVGSIGKWTVDPSPVPAEVRQGWLRFSPRKLVSFDPHPGMTFTADWTASGPVVSGEGVIEGARVPFVGDVRSGAGALQMEIVLGGARSDHAGAATGLRRRGGSAAARRAGREARRGARRSGG